MQTRTLTSHTGVEVKGIDLAGAVTADERAELNRLFVQHAVLVARDQQLNPHGVLRAVRLFGDVFEQHNTRFQLPECPEIHYLSNEDRYPDGTRYIPGAGYHTDHSNALEPPKATALYAVELPGSGGDTQFVNMQQVYAALDAELRQRIDPLRGVHVYQSRHSKRKLMSLKPDREAHVPDAVSHPLVRTHPESGRCSVYLNPIRIERIEGMDEDAALVLLDELLAFATRPEFEYRHRWQPGDLVLWDNRCLLHKANGDYNMAERRYLYRVMLKGDRPH